jgi:hypothetical protein
MWWVRCMLFGTCCVRPFFYVCQAPMVPCLYYLCCCCAAVVLLLCCCCVTVVQVEAELSRVQRSLHAQEGAWLAERDSLTQGAWRIFEALWCV